MRGDPARNWSRLVIPSLAVTEVRHLLADPQRRGRVGLAAEFCAAIADDELRVIEITPHDYRRMAELLTTYSSLRLQAVDACVIALAERLEVLGSRPHGHVQAVRVAMQRLGIDSLIGARPSPERDRILALIAARVLAPSTQRAAAQAAAGRLNPGSAGSVRFADLRNDRLQSGETEHALNHLLSLAGDRLVHRAEAPRRRPHRGDDPAA